jgi:hypothetical protein
MFGSLIVNQRLLDAGNWPQLIPLHQRASYSTRDFETKHILGIDISIPRIT